MFSKPVKDIPAASFSKVLLDEFISHLQAVMYTSFPTNK